jgi:putative ABC transport system permease protein
MREQRVWFLRLSGLFRKERRDRELDAELESHLQMHIEDNLRAGMTPEEARRQALIKLGGVEPTKERYRERRGLPFVETTLQDVRYGLRVLLANPGVTIVAIVTLALAIGVNTTIFSAANGFLLRKPPVPDPDRLMVLSSINPAKEAYAPDRTPVSALDFLDWSAQATSFAELAASTSDDFTVSGDASPQRALGTRVSSNYFQVLDVTPALGRTIGPDENQPGRNSVVILSDELWQERFGGDPNVLGHTIKVNGNRSTVIGVMPRTFRLWGQFQAELWVPLVFSPNDLRPTARSQRSLLVIARLKSGVDERHARAEMQTIAQRLAQGHKETNDGWGASVASIQHFNVADSNVETAIVFLMGAVGFVLLIACTNLANLLLARNAARQREFSIRSVLGAGRLRLARQLLTECLLLSLAGGTLGILFAFGAVRAVQSQLNWNEYAAAMAKEVTVDIRVLIFTIGVSVAAAILFGLAPAIQIARRDPSDGLKEGGRGSTPGRGRNRLQRLLVIGQLALSVFLLVGTGLFVQSFLSEMRASTGFNSHNLLTASVSLRGLEYFEPPRQKQFFESVLQRLANLPEAQSAALTSDLPFSFPAHVWLTLEGHPVSKPEDRPTCGYFAVSPGYFVTTQIPLLQGRTFTASDTADSAPVVIIDEAFAKRYFADENPIGRRIRFEHEDHRQSQWSEIVGISANVNEYLAQQKPRPHIFVPFAANPDGTMYLIVRTHADPATASNSFRGAVWAVDGDQAVTGVRTMDRVITDSLGGDDLMSEMMGTFALLALLMAACGIFGVVSYLVSQRTHEMGIRLALGSEPRQILLLLLRNGMTLVGIGTAIGFLISLALPKLVAASFQGFSGHSAPVLVLAPAVLLLVGFLACYVPARRAMRVDPMVALRYE